MTYRCDGCGRPLTDPHDVILQPAGDAGLLIVDRPDCAVKATMRHVTRGRAQARRDAQEARKTKIRSAYRAGPVDMGGVFGGE